jgi:uncharacterized protein
LSLISGVLDSYSLIAYLEGEQGKEKVIELIQDARDSQAALFLSIVNWGEVYYITLREAGRKRLAEVIHLISILPIQIVQADLEVTRQAAEFKSCKKMSYADCYAAATAKRYKAELVTGDREFKQVEKEIKIIWIH